MTFLFSFSDRYGRQADASPMRLTIVRKQNRRLAHLLWIGILFLSLSDCVSALDVKANQNDVQEKTAVELEEISAGIDQRLESIAEYNLRSGMGAIGYRSKAHPDAKHTEWFEVELESEQSIDEIVLVPNVLRDAQSNFVGDGFPVKLRVIFGTGSGPTRTTVDQIEVTHQSPRQIAPLIIPMKKAKASWVRIEATELSKRSYDDSYIFQFAEILVFAGHRNLALRQPVKVSSDAPTGSGAWGSSFAVDGFLPYLMNSATGQGALPFVSVVGIGKQPTLTIDLEVEAPVSRINLHLVEQSDTVPQSFSGDFGFPRQLKIEGASREDFSDAKVLSVTAYENSYQFGPIVLLQFKPHSCRFIKVTAVEPYFFGYPGDDVSETRIGFAEIEVFSEAENLALGKAVVANFRQGASLVSSITDGKNRYGPVIQIRDWMSELSERHSLETQRPLIAAELNKRYQKQRQNFKWLIGLATLLGLSAIIVGLVGWQLRERAVQKTREQIAANLHDELGANIHAMGLVSDMARASSNDPERLDQLMLRMRELSERAGKAAAHCANMLESEGLFDDLITDMQLASSRITADFEHQFVVTGEQKLQLKPKRRIGLFLFYKECLTNVLRHSNASQLKTDLTIDTNQIQLAVTDNGSGLQGTNPGQEVQTTLIPKSLRRRAKLLGGKVTARHVESGGTEIKLILR